MRVLITSGGGAKGAFSVGALAYLQTQGKAKFDLISGTSTGSLIATFAAANQIDFLRNVYATVDNNDLLRKQNVIDNFLFDKPFLFDTEPLQQLIMANLDEAMFQQIMNSSTTLCLTATSLQTGRSTVFCTKPIRENRQFYDTRLITSRKMLLDAMQASSNQAGFLPPIDIINPITRVKEQFVDGGNREVIPTRVVVEQNPTEIVVLSNNPSRFEVQSRTINSILDAILRAITIFIQEVRENDLAVLADYCQRSNARSITIEPDHDLDPFNPTGLNFDKIAMGGWQIDGFEKARLLIPPAMPIAFEDSF